MTVIGLTGEAGCGKTTAANVLVDKGYQKLSFATPVKKLAYKFGWDGKKDDRGRRLLQLVGTEIGRWYDPDIWVKKAAEAVKDIDDTQKLYMAPTLIVFDDVRFANEASLIKKLDGFIIELVGCSAPLAVDGASHASEQGIPNELIDYHWEFPCFNSADLFAKAFKEMITDLVGE